jgi:hypothetical protein
VLDLLNKYPYFSSIEATTKSDALRLYFFLTTNDQFDQGKKFVTEQLPKMWAKLERNFLEELPQSVKCPRLTTSNLSRDESTTKTAKMLEQAYSPEMDTGESKWSNAPKINKPPTQAVIVNYSEQDFPALKRQPSQQTTSTDANQKRTSSSNKSNQIDSSSTHSDVSATSEGTTFTSEDGQSLFTSLTESFISDMKSQTEAVMKQNQTPLELVASQADM